FADALVAFVRRFARRGPPYARALDLQQALDQVFDDDRVDAVFRPYRTEALRVVQVQRRGERFVARVHLSGPADGRAVDVDWQLSDGEGSALASGAATLRPGEQTLEGPCPPSARAFVLDPDHWIPDPVRDDNRAVILLGSP
ncbi:MAG: hypothetical protein AAF938_04730, partial [Myxococcota bacterium]